MDKDNITLSVRNLIEFIYRYGSIESGVGGMTLSSAREGVKIHQLIQKDLKEQSKTTDNMEFLSEVYLSHSFEIENLSFTIEGRADGVIITDNEITVIEIKSTSKDLIDITMDNNPLHWAQVKIYAYIYGLQNSLDNIKIQLIYCNREKFYTKILEETLTFTKAKSFFYSVLNDYLKWAHLSSHWLSHRNSSIESLSFPYDTYRNGQRQLAIDIYSTIKLEKNIYVEAPTGIGKTLSTTFPAIKALGNGYGKKVIYLTAKNTTQDLAENTINLLRHKGLKIKSLKLTAKERICYNSEFICDSESCLFAKGHYDRVNDGIYDILTSEDNINRENLEIYSKKHNLCPFEFSLDLFNFCDFIICDYNYFFDPRVMLKRASNNGDYILLVDEAHNLVDRARDMYSTSICESNILLCKKKFGRKGKKLRSILNSILEILYEFKEEKTQYWVIESGPKEIAALIKDFLNNLEFNKQLKEELFKDNEFVDIYFNFLQFVSISEFYSEEFITYGEEIFQDYIIKIFCLNPNKVINQCIKGNRSTVFFSATLSPMNYFKELLGGSPEDYEVKLKSPFNPNHKEIIIGSNIDTRYKMREGSYIHICKYIKEIVTLHKGNYMVFFPSYDYLLKVYDMYIDLYNSNNLIKQESSMNEDQRIEFLDSFNKKQNDIIGFCVLGGIFSEGIDLIGDKLIGAIIVGVGLPQISFERSSIEKYFSKLGKLGFHYAYTFPGMNKVIQAAGRVIRTEEDKGIICLLDNRYDTPFYKKLMPKDWSNHHLVRDLSEIKTLINNSKLQ